MNETIRQLFSEMMVNEIDNKIAAKLQKFYPVEVTPTLDAIEELLKRDEEWGGDY
jgi:hypothetical protein